MSYWLSKALGSNDGENLGKLVPLVIFFVIWVFGAIAKVAQKGKHGTEHEPEVPDEGQEPSFDDLAEKIRQRHTGAQKEAGRVFKEGENKRYQPPAKPSQPKTLSPRRSEPKIPPKPAVSSLQSSPEQEGPKLKVVKGLEMPAVGEPLPADKPVLQKVKPDMQKVQSLTPETAKVSAEPEIIHHQYLTELAEQYSATDGFLKAVLTYEILGPPVVLRDAVETRCEVF